MTEDTHINISDASNQGAGPPPKAGTEAATEDLLLRVNRALPFSDEAEKGVLSCLLQDPEIRVSETRAQLPPEAFYVHCNRLIYEALIDMDTARIGIDVVSVTNWLRDRQQLDRVGGASAVSELYTFVPIAAHYEYYVKIVRGKWLLRLGVHAAARGITDLFEHGKEDPSEDPAATLSKLEAGVFSVLSQAQGVGGASGPQPAVAYMGAWEEHIYFNEQNQGKITGVPSGLLDIDRTFHGFDDKNGGELVVIAARPGMGKTAMAMTIAEHVGLDCNIPCAFFSMEMGDNQLFDRMIYSRAGVDTQKAMNGHSADHEKKLVAAAKREFEKSALIFDFSSNPTSAELRSRCQVLKRTHGIRMAVFDHLDHIAGVSKKAEEDERMRIVETMMALHWIRKELGIVVVLLVQLNEASEKNPGRLPVLSDLHGSGHIGRLASQVGFIQRPSFYKPWGRLTDEQQDKWRERVDFYRAATPANWSQSTDYSAVMANYDESQGGLYRLMWEEHAIFAVRKNRRGPTPDNIALRFRKELARFCDRTAELKSSNPAKRQVVLPVF